MFSKRTAISCERQKRFVQPVNVAAIVALRGEIYIDGLGGRVGPFGFWVSYCRHRSQLFA